MGNSYFKFKQFTVRHDKCAMKVGTDGVLLGAYADCVGRKRCLDVGTGTGLVALMLAQRSNAKIVGVEIEPNAVVQAKENVLNSPWSTRVSIIQGDIAAFESLKKFDLIVSNPPYFLNSLQAKGSARMQARHGSEMFYHQLFIKSAELLNRTGILQLILPYDLVEFSTSVALKYNLYLREILSVAPKVGGEFKRAIVTLSLEEGELKENKLEIEKDRHAYTDEYKQLTSGFYLNM